MPRFLYYDIASGKTRDLGRVQNWDAIGRTLALDDRGRVFGPWGQRRLWRYDAETDAIDNLLTGPTTSIDATRLPRCR